MKLNIGSIKIIRSLKLELVKLLHFSRLEQLIDTVNEEGIYVILS